MNQAGPLKLSDQIGLIEPSLTLEITALAARLKAEGKPVIAFAAGEPDLPTPDAVQAAGKEAIDQGLGRYTAAAGTPKLREALAARFTEDGLAYAPDEVLVTSGAKSAFFLPDPAGPLVLTTGLFALSGALTNWVAVHMLFERVPGLYGTGVIQLRFAEFKTGIHGLIMKQFFTRENMERLLALESASGGPPLDVEKLQDAIDYDEVFAKVSEAVMSSKLGGMLGMFGGASVLENLRDPVKEKLRLVVSDVLTSDRFQGALQQSLSGGTLYDEILEKVNTIVGARLDELSATDVKRIVQDMIREHLGWLVVWGGVFGGLLGLLAGLLVR